MRRHIWCAFDNKTCITFHLNETKNEESASPDRERERERSWHDSLLFIFILSFAHSCECVVVRWEERCVLSQLINSLLFRCRKIIKIINIHLLVLVAVCRLCAWFYIHIFQHNFFLFFVFFLTFAASSSPICCGCCCCCSTSVLHICGNGFNFIRLQQSLPQSRENLQSMKWTIMNKLWHSSYHWMIRCEECWLNMYL